MATVNTVVAAGLLVFRRLQNRIEYLLLQASNGEHHWTPPKGHVDPGESEIETALRETEEEAGLTKNQLTVLTGFEKSLYYTAWGKPKRVVYWLSELKNPEDAVKLSHEHQDYRWAAFEEACKLVKKYQDMVKLLEEANSFLISKCKP